MIKFPKPYLEFIESPHWLLKRAAILKRDHYRCCNCKRQGSKGNPLEVDHEIYPPWNAPLSAYINQPNSQLKTLCWECHKAKTENDRRRRSIARNLVKSL